MAEGYTGDLAILAQAHKDTVATKEQLEGELKQVWNHVTALQSIWAGTAQKAFTELMTRFERDAKSLNDALQGIADQMAGAGSTYQEQEESKNSTFGNLAGRLNG
ncbi:WXG100 family type VII secretion target [Herbihabitans rhizosphaerae]|uniref:ESAT-6-like protein n=1 Tax=Herbihabitans rhizosphaerae TaxID=1872711 RepID=A0A4Q7KMI5_9PSEU|nr:WXG100 family type VII secretion target [Herbihabitans rhizosphaerae]RZS37130.1 WXG100 family type VII secretion target [Herbihabitans rhizosphaerae]